MFFDLNRYTILAIAMSALGVVSIYVGGGWVFPLLFAAGTSLVLYLYYRKLNHGARDSMTLLEDG